MKKKGRPSKIRKVEKAPKIVQFSPRGKPGRPDEVQLKLDEFEALKLADLRGLNQKAAADSMSVSRATFGRILREARKKISDAIVNGKIIRIYGGSIEE